MLDIAKTLKKSTIDMKRRENNVTSLFVDLDLNRDAFFGSSVEWELNFDTKVKSMSEQENLMYSVECIISQLIHLAVLCYHSQLTSKCLESFGRYCANRPAKGF